MCEYKAIKPEVMSVGICGLTSGYIGSPTCT